MIAIRSTATSAARTTGRSRIEYRPIEDLLLRATVSKVFRAPTPDQPVRRTNARRADGDRSVRRPSELASNAACRRIQRSAAGVLAADRRIAMGSQFAADHGLSSAAPAARESASRFDYGFVYDPGLAAGGLSVNADYFRILLNNLDRFRQQAPPRRS